MTEKRAYFDEFFLTGSVFKKLGSPPDMVTLKSIRPCKAVFKAHMVLNFSLVLFFLVKLVIDCGQGHVNQQKNLIPFQSHFGMRKT